MVPRYKKLASQLGKKIPNHGSVLASAVTVLKKKREKKTSRPTSARPS